MKELKLLRIWCEAQIELMQRTIGKRGLISRMRRRWLMAEICGIQKVINRIDRMMREM